MATSGLIALLTSSVDLERRDVDGFDETSAICQQTDGLGRS
jgi:hypothetical protein